MTITPELEPPSAQPKPETPTQQGEPPKEMPAVEEHGTTHAPGNLAAQAVQSSNVQQPVPAQSPQVVTITVPATTQQLDDWSKGTTDDSITWLAFYWIRMIKKAFFHGYRVVTQGM